jgi:hypothetical protein
LRHDNDVTPPTPVGTGSTKSGGSPTAVRVHARTNTQHQPQHITHVFEPPPDRRYVKTANVQESHVQWSDPIQRNSGVVV